MAKTAHQLFVVFMCCLCTLQESPICRQESIRSSRAIKWCADCSFCYLESEEESTNTAISCKPCPSYAFFEGASAEIAATQSATDSSNCVASKFTSDTKDGVSFWCTECTACFRGEGQCLPCVSSFDVAVLKNEFGDEVQVLEETVPISTKSPGSADESSTDSSSSSGDSPAPDSGSR